MKTFNIYNKHKEWSTIHIHVRVHTHTHIHTHTHTTVIGWLNGLKQDLYICCLQETHFRLEDTHRLKVKKWKKIFHDGPRGYCAE